MQGLKARLDVLTDILQNEAGKDNLQDRFHSGYIAAVKDMLNISVEDL